jgi:drug/metabolite transporter (DMT)-like permease
MFGELLCGAGEPLLVPKPIIQLTLPPVMARASGRHFLLLHLIVFIWGFSPVLGRFITADTMQLVWFRILITVAVMYVYIKFTKQAMGLEKGDLLKLAGTGIIILIHWLTFYGAIKVSNISVTMVAFSTGTLFSAIIEPALFKRRVRPYEVVIGLIIISAIALIFSIEFQFWQGIVLGIIAAFTSSLFGVFNGLFARRIKPAIISFYELSAALLGLTVFLVVTGNFNERFFMLNNQAILGIVVLSLVCTVYPFITSVNLARYISPYTIVLTVNLETVYGIIWAILFYNENKELKPTFYVGVVIILSAIFLNSWLRALSEKKSPKLE